MNCLQSIKIERRQRKSKPGKKFKKFVCLFSWILSCISDGFLLSSQRKKIFVSLFLSIYVRRYSEKKNFFLLRKNNFSDFVTLDPYFFGKICCLSIIGVDSSEISFIISYLFPFRFYFYGKFCLKSSQICLKGFHFCLKRIRKFLSVFLLAIVNHFFFPLLVLKLRDTDVT